MADRGVRIVLGTAVDMSGVTRAKGVPVDRLEAFVHNGMGASPSWNVFCVDFGIAFTPDLGVTGDLRLRIDPDPADRRRRRRRLGTRLDPPSRTAGVHGLRADAARARRRPGPGGRAAAV